MRRGGEEERRRGQEKERRRRVGREVFPKLIIGQESVCGGEGTHTQPN